MDNSHENLAEKRKVEEITEGDVRSVKMESDHVVDHVQPNTTPGPRRKKFKKQKKDVDKSALMLFNETFPSVEFTLESSSGPSHQPEFVMFVALEGKYSKFWVLSNSMEQKIECFVNGNFGLIGVCRTQNTCVLAWFLIFLVQFLVKLFLASAVQVGSILTH